MDETESTAEPEALGQPGRRAPLVFQINQHPAWTPEEARVKAALGGRNSAGKPKHYTLRGALAKRLKQRRPDGSRPWDDALAGLVEKLAEGDVRAIELALNHVDGPLVQTRKVERTDTKRLLVQPLGDARGRVVEAQQVSAPPSDPSAVPAQLEAPEVGSMSDNGSSVAQENSSARAVASVVPAPELSERDAWTDGTD